MNRIVEVHPDADAASDAAERRVARCLSRDRSAAPSIALSGGTTPKRLYGLLGEDAGVPWGTVRLFWVDERFVARDSPDSNYGLVESTLGTPRQFDPKRRYAVDVGAASVQAAATAYDATLRREFPPRGPALDVAILGVGDDGHTASIFPGDRADEATRAWAVAVPVAGHAPFVPRVSMSLEFLSRTRTVVVLVTGAEKAAIVHRILRPGTDADRRLPAARVAAADDLVFVLDVAAARGSGAT